MDKDKFIQQIKSCWPNAFIIKIVSISPEHHIAIVSVDRESKPFFVGIRHNIVAPIDTRTIKDARQRYADIVSRLDGLLDVMDMLLTPHEPHDWKAFNELVGIDAPADTTE